MDGILGGPFENTLLFCLMESFERLLINSLLFSFYYDSILSLQNDRSQLPHPGRPQTFLNQRRIPSLNNHDSKESPDDEVIS